MTTMSELVWVKLYIEGEDKPKGRAFKVARPSDASNNWDIDDLTKAVKATWGDKIGITPEMYVYPPGTKVTADGGTDKNCFETFDKIDELIDQLKDTTPPTDGHHPLIVVAPAPQPVTPVTTVKDDQDRRMETLVLHWSASTLFDRKRPREPETFSEARKKPAVEKKVSVAPTNDDDDQTTQAARKTCVRVFPTDGLPFYLGDEDEPFYLRDCVNNLLSLVFDEISDTEKLNGGPRLYIISGATGIGKSWSINAFMSALLGAKKKVFLHHGATGRAWKITDSNTVERVDAGNITVLGKEWVYVYDSPGLKPKPYGGSESAAFHRTGKGCVTFIFSSPKAQHYDFAVAKGGGIKKIFNLPTWTRQEMLQIEKIKDSDSKVFNACYDVWGGNMRAMSEFLQQYRETPALQEMTKSAEKELDAHIEKIDKDFAQKMSRKLEKQEVEGQFTGVAIANSPGHILVPEPLYTDPSQPKYFTEFMWRFCSPLAEKKFWKHAKAIDHDALKKLLISVFQVPSPKGVLFEKVANTLVTNGVVKEFRCYPYNKQNSKMKISFQQCLEEMTFESDELKDKFSGALLKLDGKTGSIALEPKDTSYHAVDMFVLEKQGTTGTIEDWSLHMLQDTIAKTHSFHPVKVLWYCSLFCDAFKETFSGAPPILDSDLLKCCKYVPLIPQSETNFSFENPTSTAVWKELERVSALLDFTLPDFSSKRNTLQEMQDLVEAKNLVIPPTTNGTPRKLTKPVVGNALLLENAAEKVKLQCNVIFDVVNTWDSALTS